MNYFKRTGLLLFSIFGELRLIKFELLLGGTNDPVAGNAVDPVIKKIIFIIQMNTTFESYFD